jgi:hypothetical protein
MLRNEIWKADGTLGRLQFVCIACHGVAHFGRSSALGYREQALSHLAKVNGISMAEAKEYALSKEKEWREAEHA